MVGNEGAGGPVVRDTLLHLKAQVAEGDPEARQVLFEEISNLLLNESLQASEDEKEIMDEILGGLIDQIEFSIRKSLAARLAKQEAAPHKLLNYLIRDDIKIARPILLSGVALTDADLVGVIDDATRDHRLSVAMRDKVSEFVSDALVGSGEIQVIVTLLENPGARLSSEATNSLVKSSQDHEAIRSPLLAREELNACQAHTMFWWVSSALRGNILENFQIDEETLDLAMEASVKEGVQEAIENQQLALMLKTVALVDRRALSDLLSYLKGSSGAKLNAKFAHLFGISERTAHKILSDNAGDALAVCCKAIDADRQQFTRLFLLIDYKRYGQNRPIGHLATVSASYDAISSTKARKTLCLWEAQELAMAA